METDEDGYVTVIIDDTDALEDIEDVRYRGNDKDIAVDIVWE